MSHKHAFTQRDYITLTLPDTAGRYDLLHTHRCTCGENYVCTSNVKNTGRHLTLPELREVYAREQARPKQRRKTP